MRYCDVPEIAAARCSESQLFAVPGSPIRRRTRSEAKVAMATCTRFRFPMYFGVIVTRQANSRIPPDLLRSRGERNDAIEFNHIASFHRDESTICGLAGSGTAGILKREDPVRTDEGILNAKRTIWNKRHLCQSGARICRENVDDPPRQAPRGEGRGRLWASRHRHRGRLP